VKRLEKKITILLTSLVLAALAIGSIGFVLADTGDPILGQVEGVDIPCLGLGPRGLIEGRGVWANLTQDQSDELVANIEALRDADATHEEIREYIAGKLDVWGLEAPMWSGPHYGDNEQGFRGQRNGYGGNGMGSRMRGQGRGYGGNGGFGQGVCPNVSG
jgi:hypothetical protein